MDKDLWLKFKSSIIEYLIAIGPNLLFALLGLIVGLFLIKILMRMLRRVLHRSNVELSLKTFVESLSVFLLYALLLFLVGSILGIKTTSFIAVFGAAGIAVALALQGSLANFAGGVLILVFKPFKVNDLIHVNNNTGYVQKIDILYTRIKTFDGRIITMPNGNVSNSDIDNHTMENYRRIDLELKFSFDEDIDKLRAVVETALRAHPKLVHELPIEVFVGGMGEYDMKVKARSWTVSTEYWQVFFEQTEAVKKALDKAGIKIPVPKHEIFQKDTE